MPDGVLATPLNLLHHKHFINSKSLENELIIWVFYTYHDDAIWLEIKRSNIDINNDSITGVYQIALNNRLVYLAEMLINLFRLTDVNANYN